MRTCSDCDWLIFTYKRRNCSCPVPIAYSYGGYAWISPDEDATKCLYFKSHVQETEAALERFGKMISPVEHPIENRKCPYCDGNMGWWEDDRTWVSCPECTTQEGET